MIANKLKIPEFLSVATQLANVAAQIIQQVSLSKDLQKQMKDIDDPMTVADIKAQTIIINGIRKFWPNIRIVGEEEQQYNLPIEFDLNTLNPHLFPAEIFAKNLQNAPVDTEVEINDRLVVWVDPLDGTLSYVNNELDAVTTLIGVSVDGKPLFSVIGQPYQNQKDKGDEYIFRPKLYFGHANQQRLFYVYGDQLEKVETLIPYEMVRPTLIEKNNHVFCTSSNRIKQETEDQIRTLNIERLMKEGGSGKKTLNVLEGICDFYIYVGMKTKKWDTCAPDALLKCFQGSLVGLAGQVYEYDADDKGNTGDDYGNPYGIIATLHPQNVLDRYLAQTKGFM